MSKSWVYVGHRKNFNQKNLPLAKKVKNKKKSSSEILIAFLRFGTFSCWSDLFSEHKKVCFSQIISFRCPKNSDFSHTF